MKHTILMLSLVGARNCGATAAEVKPGNVSFENGAVEQSLTGSPAIPNAGARWWVTSRSAIASPVMPFPR